MRVPSPQPWQKIETNQGITSVAEVLNGKGAPLLDDDSLMREFSEVLDKIAVKL